MSADIWADIRDAAVPAGTMSAWWLYQAGIAVKTPAGVVALVDAYLSNAVADSKYRIHRAVESPVRAADVKADVVLATHSHADHLDPGSIDDLLADGPAVFIGPPMAAERVLSHGVDPVRVTAVSRGEAVSVGDLTIRVVHARHMFGEEPTPDAVGFVLESGAVSIYHSGDTEYDSEIVADTRDVSVSFISINGTTGNMNAHEAAMLAWLQRAGTAVPFHYGLWDDADYGEDATLDPQLFVDTYHRLKPHGHTHVLTVGRAITIDRTGIVDQDEKETGL